MAIEQAEAGVAGYFHTASTETPMNSVFPKRVRIFEVGPRDGLQNQPQQLTTAIKVELIEGLSDTGLTHIEAGSFVNPKWVPQMAGSDEVFSRINRRDGITYSALTPNLKGFERAVAAAADEVAIFTAASETFSQRNSNCSIEESLRNFEPLVMAAQKIGLNVRGYVSCAVGCPYEGAVATSKVAALSRQLYELGCYEISLGDTIGIGTPASITRLLEACLQQLRADTLAVHLHDTYGQAVTNIYTALQMGIAVIDSSVAGLGGCPYAKGASGNVATEDVLYMLNGLGIEHGIDLHKLVTVGDRLCRQLNHENGSKVAKAILNKLNN